MAKGPHFHFGPLGNGLTVWDGNDPKRETLAHISAYRLVTFMAENLPEPVKEGIRAMARTSTCTISTSQDDPVFRCPPIKGTVYDHIGITQHPDDYEGRWDFSQKMAYDICEMFEDVTRFHCMVFPDELREEDSDSIVCAPYAELFAVCDSAVCELTEKGEARSTGKRLADSIMAGALEVFKTYGVILPEQSRLDNEEAICGKTYAKMHAAIENYANKLNPAYFSQDDRPQQEEQQEDTT